MKTIGWGHKLAKTRELLNVYYKTRANARDFNPANYKGEIKIVRVKLVEIATGKGKR